NVSNSSARIDDLMLASGFVGSRSAARRLVAQKAVKVDERRISDPAEHIDVPADGVILRVGKRRFARVLVSRLPEERHNTAHRFN
ncbi:MAG: S4 domain-containing protein, partial [Spirochaetaceae bacterium]